MPAGTHIFQYGLDYIFTLLQYKYIIFRYCKIGAGHFPRRCRGTDLITVDNRVGRSFILVVEPSSQFPDRCLAADCPIPSFSQNVHAHRFQSRCRKEGSKEFQQFTQLYSYPLPDKTPVNLTEEVEELLLVEI